MQLQLIFNDLCQEEQDKRYAMECYRNELQSNKEYLAVTEEVKALQENRKKIEMQIAGKFPDLADKVEKHKINVKHIKGTLTEEAVTLLMSGKPVEVEDEKGNKYEPVWSVKFKKTKRA